ncbi:MAG TPA: glycosyl hydrolase, partial [Acidimicrobiales bacterium]|nr:glycosyl hydrolase [Acidimicrobiales bacterium]
MYSFWLGGNVTKEGISADLEAMHQAGIRGMLFMDGAIGNPPGPYRFMSESWLEMFDHMLAEAARLGIEFNLNNDPGWAGSGGPWVTPETATQRVIVTQTVLDGPSQFDAILAQPAEVNHGYYQDIAVVAYPLPADGTAPSFRIPDFNSTKSFAGGHDFAGVVPWPRFIPTSAEWPVVPTGECVQAEQMLDLTAKMGKGGNLSWTVPSGRWMVLRFGHTVANGATRSAQEEAKGLECNKLSKAAVEVHFSHVVGKLTQRAGSLVGKTLVSAHIDSWEAGSGNWTDGFLDEFRRRRGYDLLPFLATVDGIVVDSREISERFLWDYRETICELMLENYAGHFRELAHSKGLRLSIEGYDGICDDLRYAGCADEPMAEFWRGCYNDLPLSDLSESMASAAHVYGRQIVAAEAFTSFRGDFLDHPATLKPLADWAFCTGVNRLCFSEWIVQPWPRLVPGVSFSTIGTVFHRSVTWWEQSRPWHEYIARCQYMLRQGQFIADICFVAPEGGPYRFAPPIPATTRGVIPDRPEYNFDGCPAELVIKEMTVQDGKVTLPSGMKYQLLVLPTYNAQDLPVVRLMDADDYFYKAMPMPKVQTMTPELLRRIKELVEAGATVLGNRPLKSPSLVNFPECDNQVTQLADELWGKNAGATDAGEHRVGKGRVVWGSTPEQVLAGMGVAPDLTCSQDSKGKLNYTHRQAVDGSDIYFIVNKQPTFLQTDISLRVFGKRPELYWPQSGNIEPAMFFEE